MDYAAESRNPEIVEDLMQFFLSKGLNDCFTSMLYKCYDLLKPDVVLELAWNFKITDFAIPYFVQVLREYGGRVSSIRTFP
jgi:clathrin heavy chain